MPSRHKMSEAARKRAAEAQKERNRTARKDKQSDEELTNRIKILLRIVPHITKSQLSRRLHIAPERCSKLLKRAGLDVTKPEGLCKTLKNLRQSSPSPAYRT